MSNAGSTLKSAPLGTQAPAKKGTSLFNSGKPKEFKKKELVQMFRGISSMLRAQINTADALKYYAQGLDNKIMAEALLRIREDINAGIAYSVAPGVAQHAAPELLIATPRGDVRAIVRTPFAARQRPRRDETRLDEARLAALLAGEDRS